MLNIINEQLFVRDLHNKFNNSSLQNKIFNLLMNLFMYKRFDVCRWNENIFGANQKINKPKNYWNE